MSARAGRSGRATPELHRARWLVVAPDRVVAHGAIEVQAGRVVRVHGGAQAARRAGARVHDHGASALVPGFVDAHAHLELSGLAGRLPRGGSFAAWVEALLASRGQSGDRDLAADARAGADRLIATGTTAVGDIDSSGAIDRALARHPLRARVYREVLDAGDPTRTAAALAHVDRALRVGVRRARTWSGLSPHAPYSVSRELWRALGARARQRRLAVGIHWAETREETDWLERGEGPLERLVVRSPRASGLELIESARLLGPRTVLYHGNHPARGDRERVAASGACLVHCPGTHDFFGRERFAIERWLAAGVTVALGTDSLASNEDLDMRREMALLRASSPSLAPAVVLALATTSAARALGFEGRAGTLAPGAWADFAVHEVGVGNASGLVDALTSAASEVTSVWIGGRRAWLRGVSGVGGRGASVRL